MKQEATEVSRDVTRHRLNPRRSRRGARQIRSLFQGVEHALGDHTRSLHQLAGDHETPDGTNERIRTTWFDAANSEALTTALDALLSDLQ